MTQANTATTIKRPALTLAGSPVRPGAGDVLTGLAGDALSALPALTMTTLTDLPGIPRKAKKEIVAYLLVANEKSFTAAADGGHAVTLISRGIGVRHMIPGQQALSDDVPFSIPDNVWAVLEKNKDKFPVGTVDFNEPYPWRMSAWG